MLRQVLSSQERNDQTLLKRLKVFSTTFGHFFGVWCGRSLKKTKFSFQEERKKKTEKLERKFALFS
jgi:hypothetical protein